jgi:hypothetical protein
MRFRKLRIAWSLAWGLVAVLLIALWVRSYWYDDGIYYLPGSHPSKVVGFESVHGNIMPFSIQRGGIAGEKWHVFSGQIGRMPGHLDLMEIGTVDSKLIHSSKWFRSFGWLTAPNYFFFSVPHWFIALVAVALGSVSWFPWIPPHRFTLRTLLIGMTLLAVVLGLAVWATR